MDFKKEWMVKTTFWEAKSCCTGQDYQEQKTVSVVDRHFWSYEKMSGCKRVQCCQATLRTRGALRPGKRDR